VFARLWAWLHAPFHPQTHVPSKAPEIRLIEDQQQRIRAELLKYESDVQLRKDAPR
jgi:hypothetical protein